MTDLSDTELRAWQALLHAHHDITKKLDADLRREHGLSFDSYDVLLRIARASGGALRMKDLADRVMVPHSTLTRRVDRLVEQGLVERERPTADARTMLTRLTRQGRRVLARAARTHLDGIRRHYTGQLSSAQLAAVAEALEIIAGPHHEH